MTVCEPKIKWIVPVGQAVYGGPHAELEYRSCGKLTVRRGPRCVNNACRYAMRLRLSALPALFAVSRLSRAIVIGLASRVKKRHVGEDRR